MNLMKSQKNYRCTNIRRIEPVHCSMGCVCINMGSLDYHGTTQQVIILEQLCNNVFIWVIIFV
jgi:hypothetical protein